MTDYKDVVIIEREGKKVYLFLKDADKIDLSNIVYVDIVEHLEKK